MNNQRIGLLRGEDEKSGATHTAASEEKKPQPKFFKANITEPVPYGNNRVRSAGTFSLAKRIALNRITRIGTVINVRIPAIKSTTGGNVDAEPTVKRT